MISHLLDKLDGTIQRTGLGEDVRAVLGGAGRTFVIQAAAVGLNYFSQILLALVLGASQFGIYVFAWSLVAPLAVAAAMGLGNAAVRFVPQYSVSKEWGRIRGFLGRGAVTTIAIGAATATLGWLILPVFTSLTGEQYIDAMRVALLSIPFLALIGLFSGASRGFGWIGLAFVPQLLMVPGLVIIGVVILALTVEQPTAEQVLVLGVSACAVTALVQLLGFRRAVPDHVRSATPEFDTRLWVQVAVPLFLSDGVFLLLWSSDAVMLGIMTEPEEVAIYHACLKTAGLTLLVFNAMTALATPRFAALWVERGTAEQDRFVRSVSRWTFLLTLSLVAGVVVLGTYVLGTFGDSFVRGYPALIVLALGCLAKATTGPIAGYLAVSGHQNVVIVVTAGAATSNVLLNLLLIPQFGVMGAVIATVLADLLYQILLHELVRRRLGISAYFLSRPRVTV